MRLVAHGVTTVVFARNGCKRESPDRPGRPLPCACACTPAGAPCAANIPARSPSLKLLSPAPIAPAPPPAPAPCRRISSCTLSYVGRSRSVDSGVIPPPKNPRLAIS